MGNLVGQRLGHYRVVEKIGEGGMGEVYRAHDEALDRDVAIKVLPEELARDHERMERFQREARAAAALDHPNILAVHELGLHQDRPFMVTELLEGRTVRQAIDASELTNRQVIDISTQIVDGLAAAHDKGIVHRDLKPSNLFLTSGGLAKILDFGLAGTLQIATAPGDGDEAPTEEMLTAVGTVLGTSGYMSPEQVRGQRVDHRSDIFSLGVVIYEMLTGLSPFRRITAADTVSAVLSEDPPPASATTSKVTPAFDGVVRRCLQKRPEDRFQTARDLGLALTSLVSVPVAPQPTRSVVRPSSKILIVVPVALAAALAFVLLHMGYRALLEDGAGVIERTLPPRIVVLPFENLGPAEESYFAAGMTEEITGRLASLSGLQVVSRTTARRYVDTDKSASEIGSELGVQYLLEGTVRWAGAGTGSSRVRIMPQLIRVADDSHLWAESFDRELDDVFAIQSEIAERVAFELGVSLLETEREMVWTRPTDNLEAYQAFLRGRWFASRPHFTLDNWQKKLEAYQHAVALDPDFAVAHAALATTHAELRFYGLDLSQRRVDLARAAADRALDLAPKDPRVHLFLAYYLLWTDRDADRAMEQVEIARQSMPHNAGVIQAEILVRSMQGRFREAVDLAEEAMELNPLDPSLPAQAIFDAWFLRDYPRAIRFADAAFGLAPESMWPMFGKAFAYWTWGGDLSASREALESLPRDFGAWSTWSWFWQEVFEGRFDDALGRVEGPEDGWIETKVVHRPMAFMRAMALDVSGRHDEARAEWGAARSSIESALPAAPENHLLHAALGVALAALGDRDRAVAEGRRAMELLPVSTDAFYGITCEVDMARIYTLLGERDAALDQLDRLLTIPSWISVAWIEMDPSWNSLRSHPRYDEILDRHRGASVELFR